MWVNTPAGNAPCYGCRDRSPDCRRDCERFRKWHEQRQQELEVYRKARDNEKLLSNFRSEMVRKQRRKSGK